MPTDAETARMTISGVTKIGIVPAWLIIMGIPQPMIAPTMPPAYVNDTGRCSSDGSQGGATESVMVCLVFHLLVFVLPGIRNGEKTR
jgi:hypothetical protein